MRESSPGVGMPQLPGANNAYKNYGPSKMGSGMGGMGSGMGGMGSGMGGMGSGMGGMGSMMNRVGSNSGNNNNPYTLNY